MGHMNLAESAPLALAQTYLRSGASSQAEAIYRQMLGAEPDCAETWQASARRPGCLKSLRPVLALAAPGRDPILVPNLANSGRPRLVPGTPSSDRVRAALDLKHKSPARQNAPLGSS